MQKEFQVGEKPHHRVEEIQDRLDQLKDIIDLFKGSEKGMRALEEQAGLRSELEHLRETSARQNLERPERAIPSRLSDQERNQREQTEDYRADLAGVISEFLHDAFQTRELHGVVEKLKDEQVVDDFLKDRRGIEFFTQSLKDIRVKRNVTTTLQRFYQRVNRRAYRWEKAA